MVIRTKIQSRKEHLDRWTSSLNTMRREGVLTDVTMICGGKEFAAHRGVLCAACPYFKAMFTSKSQESVQGKVNVEVDDPEVLAIILDFIYTGHIRHIESDVSLTRSVLTVSHLFQLDILFEHCMETLKTNLKPDCFFDLWECAALDGRSELIDLVKSFIAINFTDACRCNDFFRLNVTHLKEVLGHPDLKNTLQDDVFRGILEWVKADEGSRGIELPRLITSVALSKLSPKYVKQLLSSENLVKENQEIFNLLVSIILEYIDDRGSRIHGDESNEAVVIVSYTPEFENSEAQQTAINMSDPLPVTTTKEFSDPDSMRDTSSDYPEESARDCTDSDLQHLSPTFSESSQPAMGTVLFCFRQQANVMGSFYRENRIWTPPKTLPFVVNEGVAVTACDGHIYFMGGKETGETNEVLNTIVQYIPASNTCKIIPAGLQIPVYGAGAATLNGQIYVIGGKNKTDVDRAVQCFDPVTGLCQQVSSLNVITSRPFVLPVCGYLFAGGTKCSEMEKYDPLVDQWTVLTSMTGHIWCSSATVWKGEIYVVKDCRNPSQVSVFNPSTNIWTELRSEGAPKVLLNLVTVTVRQREKMLGQSEDGCIYWYNPNTCKWKIVTKSTEQWDPFLTVVM